MTPVQKAALDYIAGFIREHGYSPTYDEITEALHVSRSTAYNTVARLISSGLLRVEHPGRARNLAVVHQHSPAVAAALEAFDAGSVTATQALEAIRHSVMLRA